MKHPKSGTLRGAENESYALMCIARVHSSSETRQMSHNEVQWVKSSMYLGLEQFQALVSQTGTGNRSNLAKTPI